MKIVNEVWPELDALLVEVAVVNFLAKTEIKTPVRIAMDSPAENVPVDYLSHEDDCHLIVINRWSPIDEKIATVAHECAHIIQYETGQRKDESHFGRDYIIWNGEKFQYRMNESHYDMPWEVDARKSAEKFIKDYRHILSMLKITEGVSK